LPSANGADTVEEVHQRTGGDWRGWIESHTASVADTEMLKVFRYLVLEKTSGTFGEVKFRESMGWVWERELVFGFGVDTRSGGGEVEGV